MIAGDKTSEMNVSDDGSNIEIQHVRDVHELTEAEAAIELRISIDLLQRERASGKIAFARSGRRVFYPVTCIEEYRRNRVERECQTSVSNVKALRGTGTSSGARDVERDAARWARSLKA